VTSSLAHYVKELITAAKSFFIEVLELKIPLPKSTQRRFLETLKILSSIFYWLLWLLRRRFIFLTF